MKHRKLKTCLHIVCILVLLLVLYAFMGLPVPSFKMEYRLAEKAAMVGPAKILGIHKYTRTGSYDKKYTYEILVARTNHSVILYDGKLYCRKDLGENLILVRPGNGMLVLFDEHPEAAWADVHMKITTTSDTGKPVVKSVFLEAVKRDGDGYFLLPIPRDDGTTDFSTLDPVGTGGQIGGEANVIPAYVRLYDKDGNEILAEAVDILTPAIIAHQERGEYFPNHGVE